MPNKPYVVTSTRQLLAISSPGREEIVDAFGLLGPCSVATIAQFLGRTRHALYYHVRALEKAGLLVVSTPAPKSTATHYDVPGRPLSVRFDVSTPRTRRAVIALARSRLRSAGRGFVRGCDPAIAVTQGARRNLWATHWKGWLSDKELEEANALLASLLELFGRGEKRDRRSRRPYEISFVVAPGAARMDGD